MRRIVLAILSPVLLIVSAVVLALVDICFAIFGKRVRDCPRAIHRERASIVIPNWNGRDLLANYLPGVIAEAIRYAGSEVIVVDNASTDGSVTFLRDNFPTVKVLPLDRNLGFGEGSNAGFRAASNDIVVLLNNDMRVTPGFLGPLLEPFSDELVFSVSCQIFLSDPTKRREETGLTEITWKNRRLHPSHRIDDQIDCLYPCGYPGGGSTAFDREKFLSLGGFQELFHPFYYEDTDLGFVAWKRGWKVLYQPSSVVYHEHRGTIGKAFSGRYVQDVLSRNSILYCWKNLHDWRLLGAHLLQCLLSPMAALLTGNSQDRYTFSSVGDAATRIRQIWQSRWLAHTQALISDREALRRPLGGYFRDRFETSHRAPSDRLQVLFVSPYPIEPPVHGGGVFMKNAVAALARLVDVHLVSFVDTADQLLAQEKLRSLCKSAQFLVRNVTVPKRPFTLMPHSIREFSDPNFSWAVHRSVFMQKIDVIQLEYTILSQYAERYKHIPCILFEHDIFFQSLWRSMKAGRFTYTAGLEYLRILRYELNQLSSCTRIQVCSEENKEYLLSFVPELRERIDPDLRSIIDLRSYRFTVAGREPNTLLFIGSFRHTPNVDALKWFTSEVFEKVLQEKPDTVLVITGSEPPPALAHLASHPNVRLIGFVDDIREPLRRHGVFICPILSGSGIRVKLLEAFAAGVPVVSTRVGAEGLVAPGRDVCEIADSADDFARAVLRLLADQEHSAKLALNARALVEAKHDARSAIPRLVHIYKEEVRKRRAAQPLESIPMLTEERVSY